MSEPVHARAPPDQSATGMPNPSHAPNVFVTFPIVFINHPPTASPSSTSQSTSMSTDDTNPSVETAQQSQSNASEPAATNAEPYWVNLMLQTIEGLPVMLQRLGPFMSHGPFAGPFEPVPAGPPKKHATQSAIDRLTAVDVASLPEEERRCTICMQDYFVKSVGPRSPYVEDVRDEEDFDGQDVFSNIAKLSLTAKEEEIIQEAIPTKDEGETPLRMPCGHVFGGACLKEWLYHSPTCPLCRVEVEHYTEEPPAMNSASMPGFFFEAQPPRGAPQPEETTRSDEMQVDPLAGQTSGEDISLSEQPQTTPNVDPTPSPAPPQFHPLAFQIIFTSPPSNSPAPAAAPPPSTATTPTPTLAPSIPRSATPSSRPSTSHSVRHHPYARTSTPSPLSGPSITDRPDLFCAQRLSGLCSHEPNDESHIRLECGHAFHQDCLESSMAIEGCAITNDERRCPRCRRWTNVMQ